MAKSRKSDKAAKKVKDSAESIEQTQDSVTAEVPEETLPDESIAADQEKDESTLRDDQSSSTDENAPEESPAKTEEAPDSEGADEDAAALAEKSGTTEAGEEPESTGDGERSEESSATDTEKEDETDHAELGDDTLLTSGAEDSAESTDKGEPDIAPLEETDDTSELDESVERDSSEEQGGAPETAAEPEAPKPVAAATVEQRSGSIWPAFFGGVIAALLGFIAGRGEMLDQFLPGSMQREIVDVAAIEAEASALAEANQALSSRLAILEANIAETPEVPDFSAEISGVEGSVGALTDRVSALEERPVATSSGEDVAPETIAILEEAIAAQAAALTVQQTELEAQKATLDAQQQEIAAQQAEIEGMAGLVAAAEAEAASEARRILAKAALTRVVTAVDSGESFQPALQDLEDSVPVDVPDPLRAAAESGVPTMAALQDSFPDAARAGLSAARSEVPESEVQGVTGFLRRQLSARSVVPREGDDPDAILSRVEAAVRAGDLTTAFSEIDGLPEASRSAMSDWIEAATARKAAQDAANDLANSLNSN